MKYSLWRSAGADKRKEYYNMEYLDRYEVPEEVKEAVNEYFKKELPGYQIEEITRHSDHPDDHYLYHVIAHADSPAWGSIYACWTSWNQTTKSLNYGHYNLESLDAARNLSNEKYFSAQPLRRSRGR